MSVFRQKVALHGVRFFAYHGFYPIEQTLGNEFIVDIETEFNVSSKNNDDLTQTVNYEHLYEIVSSEMRDTRKLLETVAFSIIEQVQNKFSTVETILVTIRKMHPPFRGEVNSSVVELKFSR